MSNAKQTQPPARSRKLRTESVEDHEQVIRGLAQEFLRENATANAAANRAKKARAALFAKMKSHGITSRELVVELAGHSVPVIAQVSASTRNVIDVPALAKLVGEAKVIPLASMSQDACTSAFGGAITAQVLKETTGEENVSVKVVK